MDYSMECRDCGTTLTSDFATDQSLPCPNCGSLRRRTSVGILLNIPVPHLKLKVQTKGKGTKKAAVELVQGDDLYRKSGKWNKMKRLIDRTGDDYEKLIVDPDTGEIIHHCHERLSEHQGHGSAKPPKDTA